MYLNLPVKTCTCTCVLRFSFVLRESTVAAVSLLHGSILDERQIKVEMDKGWFPGREFGRGESGAQVRGPSLRSGSLSVQAPLPPYTPADSGRAPHGL